MEEFLDLHQLITDRIASLPAYCRNDGWSGDSDHDWIIAYGDPDSWIISNLRCKKGEQMLDHYICNKCHAVSQRRTDMKYVEIQRAR